MGVFPGHLTVVNGGDCPRGVQGWAQRPLGQLLGLPLSLCPGAFIPWDRDIRQVIALRLEGWIRSRGSLQRKGNEKPGLRAPGEGVARLRLEGEGRRCPGACFPGPAGGGRAPGCPRRALGPTTAASLCAEASDAAERRARVAWCAVGTDELRKCEQWRHASGGKVSCESAPSGEDCIALVQVGARLLQGAREASTGSRANTTSRATPPFGGRGG